MRKLRRFLQLLVPILVLAGGGGNAGSYAATLPQGVTVTAPAPVTRTAHVFTIKNVYGWNDALENENAKPGTGYDTVLVSVTNCQGFGPLPAPMSIKLGQDKVFDANGHGLYGAQCVDTDTISFTVVDLTVSQGDTALFTRTEYQTPIGKDLFDIPELPPALTHPDCTPPAICVAEYDFDRVWNGDGSPGSPSAFIAFVNIGQEGNVRLTWINDAAGTETSEFVYLPRGDTFYQARTTLPFGRLRVDIPASNIGCLGCDVTPKIYAVLMRGHYGAGVAKAVIPKLVTSP